MNNPLISIIVPIYNSEKYLDKCVQSILNQSLKEIELILVDDASPDNSKDIMKKYAELDNRVVLIHNSKNGSPNPRNAGILQARGNYLGFVDADDWVEPTMYEELYKATNGEKIDVVISDLREVNENGDVLSIESLFDISIFEKTKNKTDVIKSLISNGGRLFTNIWRKDIIIDNRLLFIENNFFCDSVVNLWYIASNSFAKVDKVFYNYFVNTSSVSRAKNNLRLYDRLSAAEDMLKRSMELGLYDKYKEEIDYRFYILFYHNSLVTFTTMFSKPQYKMIDEAKVKLKAYFPEGIGKNPYYKMYHAGSLYSFVYERIIVNMVNRNTYIGANLMSLFWKAIRNEYVRPIALVIARFLKCMVKK